MNARTNLITALLTLSLIAPAAAGAGTRNIPWDPTPAKQTTPHQHTLKANSSTNAYSAWGAYVYGGASQNVAKAITDANSRTTNARGTYSNWGAYVHGGSSQKVAKAIAAAASTRTASTCLSDAQRRVSC